MGFDPRRWKPAPGSRPITSNVETLLAENDALRREVRALRLQLEFALHGRRTVEPAASHGITPELVWRWGQALARHPRWQTLRIGLPDGLRGLIEAQRRQWWNPALELEQELDRRAPGLGAELGEALRGPHSRVRWAVRAAFAVYGPSALEWLNDEPLRVVEELLRRTEQLERRHSCGQRRRGRGTRTENVSGNNSGSNAGTDDGDGDRASRNTRTSPGNQPSGSADPRQQALDLLGLELGASRQFIKRAYRRLAKEHHPDLGGDVELFHQIDAAYRLLIA
jgi:DnaJ-domain-containing protein 1